MFFTSVDLYMSSNTAKLSSWKTPCWFAQRGGKIQFLIKKIFDTQHTLTPNANSLYRSHTLAEIDFNHKVIGL